MLKKHGPDGNDIFKIKIVCICQEDNELNSTNLANMFSARCRVQISNWLVTMLRIPHRAFWNGK